MHYRFTYTSFERSPDKYKGKWICPSGSHRKLFKVLVGPYIGAGFQLVYKIIVHALFTVSGIPLCRCRVLGTYGLSCGPLTYDFTQPL